MKVIQRTCLVLLITLAIGAGADLAQAKPVEITYTFVTPADIEIDWSIDPAVNVSTLSLEKSTSPPSGAVPAETGIAVLVLVGALVSLGASRRMRRAKPLLFLFLATMAIAAQTIQLPTTSSYYLDSNVVDGTTYWYRVVVNQGQFKSDWVSVLYSPFSPTPTPSATPTPVPESFPDGTWAVGLDIPAGTYRNTDSSNSCYWERLSGFSGELDDVIANEFSDAIQTVTIKSTDVGFSSRRCGTWSQTFTPPSSGPTQPFPAGVWLVGSEVAPGTWRNSDSSQSCYWERLRGFSGEGIDIIANEFSEAIETVTIAATDVGFDSHRCGVWTRLSD